MSFGDGELSFLLHDSSFASVFPLRGKWVTFVLRSLFLSFVPFPLDGSLFSSTVKLKLSTSLSPLSKPPLSKDSVVIA